MASVPDEVRLLGLPVADEEVDVLRVEGREWLSRLYEFDVDFVLLGGASIDVRELIGAGCALAIFSQGAVRRVIPGCIAHARDRFDSESGQRRYRLRLTPTAFRTTLVQTQEVFLERSVPGIVADKLELCGVPCEFDLREAPSDEVYPTRDFVVQYGETDLAFISRLCEHVGIGFHFVERDGRDIVVFGDGGSFPRLAEAIPFRARGDQRDVFELECIASAVSKHYVVTDYNYRSPLVDLTGATALEDGTGGGYIEYGCHARDEQQAARLAQVRAEERACRSFVFEGRSDRPELAAGTVFELDGHPLFDVAEFLVIEATHEVARVAAGQSTASRYQHRFTAIPAARRFRPERRTPRPRIHGIVPGIVEALPGGSATQPWLDEHGRYRIRILFDTAAPGTEKATKPIRMAQQHAGEGYGTHFPLRPGTEVLLSFIDGDPDRPIIMGAVPNAVTPSPVVDRDNLRHRVRTASGVLIEIEDGF